MLRVICVRCLYMYHSLGSYCFTCLLLLSGVQGEAQISYLHLNFLGLLHCAPFVFESSRWMMGIVKI